MPRCRPAVVGGCGPHNNQNKRSKPGETKNQKTVTQKGDIPNRMSMRVFLIGLTPIFDVT